MGTLTWLHISDWHQKGKEFDRRKVRDALIKDIKERVSISQDLATIDFIIFSGDLAHSGKPDEYQAAKEQLLDPLLDASGLKQKKDRFFIVPGNHDLDRNAFDGWLKGLLDIFRSYERVKDFIDQKETRIKILEPFQEFARFVTDYNGQDDPSYLSIRKLEIRGKKIALMGFNSAWACGRNTDKNDKIYDRGFIYIGEPQVHDLLSKVSDVEIKIAVLHHPLEWLNESDKNRVEGMLMKGCDFLLMGHQHKQEVTIIKGTSGNCIIIPAGACYNRCIAKDEDPCYANAYNFVHLNFDSRKGIVFLRRWSEVGGKWIEDNDTFDRGKYPISIYLNHEGYLVKDDNAISENAELVVILREWKDVHHMVHSLLDELQKVDAALLKCQLSPDQLEPFLFMAEANWSSCVTDIQTMHEIFRYFKKILNVPIIENFFVQFSNVNEISKKIGNAESITEVINIQRDVGDLKNGIIVLLNVADHQIKKLVDALK